MKNNDIITDMELHQKMDRRSQILNSINDTEKALSSEIGEATREYLASYLIELKEELKKLGNN